MHPSANDFQVNPPATTPRQDLMTAAIRHLEPALRSQGRALDFPLLNRCLDAGLLNVTMGTDEEQIAKAIDSYRNLEAPDANPGQGLTG